MPQESDVAAQEWLSKKLHTLKAEGAHKLLENYASCPSLFPGKRLLPSTLPIWKNGKNRCAIQNSSSRGGPLASVWWKAPTSWSLSDSKALACTGSQRMSTPCWHCAPSSVVTDGTKPGHKLSNASVLKPARSAINSPSSVSKPNAKGQLPPYRRRLPHPRHPYYLHLTLLLTPRCLALLHNHAALLQTIPGVVPHRSCSLSQSYFCKIMTHTHGGLSVKSAE